MAAPQLNVRITAEQQDVILAAVFVRAHKSPQSLLEPLLKQLVDELLEDQRIRSAVALRRAGAAGTVVDLKARSSSRVD